MKYSLSPNARLVLLAYLIPLALAVLLEVVAPGLLAWKISEATDYLARTLIGP